MIRKVEPRFLDSQYRNGRGGNTPSNFKITIDTVEFAEKMIVKQANIVSSEYDINNRNNKLYFNVSSTDYTATLTNGKYGLSSLATEIQTAMNNEVSGNTVSADSTTFKITISRGSSFTLQLSETSNSIWKYIGFNGSSDLTGTSHLGSGLVNTSSLYYYITMDCVRNQKISKDLPYNTCAIIHNSASTWGNLLTITEPFEVDVSKDRIDEIEVKVYNNRGDLVDTEEVEINVYVEFYK